MKILAFDIEEWFHLFDFDVTRNEAIGELKRSASMKTWIAFSAY